MSSKSRFGDFRFFLGAGTVAGLVTLWSALTVHDSNVRNDAQAAVQDNTTVTSPADVTPPTSTAESTQPATTTQSTQTTTTASKPHTRTHAS